MCWSSVRVCPRKHAAQEAEAHDLVLSEQQTPRGTQSEPTVLRYRCAQDAGSAGDSVSDRDCRGNGPTSGRKILRHLRPQGAAVCVSLVRRVCYRSWRECFMFWPRHAPAARGGTAAQRALVRTGCPSSVRNLDALQKLKMSEVFSSEPRPGSKPSRGGDPKATFPRRDA